MSGRSFILCFACCFYERYRSEKENTNNLRLSCLSYSNGYLTSCLPSWYLWKDCKCKLTTPTQSTFLDPPSEDLFHISWLLYLISYSRICFLTSTNVDRNLDTLFLILKIFISICVDVGKKKPEKPQHNNNNRKMCY